ncbi:MAG: hypothetical protein AAF349_20450, partial [Cyanobacteria bacterium P01_A01_bin.68]
TKIGHGTGDTRRKISLKELLKTTFYSYEIINKVKEHLKNENFITYDIEKRDDGEDIELINLTHDSLITHWSKLRNWLDEYRGFRNRKKEIEAAAKRWEKNKFNDSSLYDEKELEDVKSLDKTFLEISPLIETAKDFIKASENYIERKKQQKRKKRIINIFELFLVVIVSLLLIYFAFIYPNIQQ